MKISTMILLCIALTIGIATLTLAASAFCPSCEQEGDWSESANSFIEGKPVDETPKLFGPKAERELKSQLSNTANTKEDASDTSDLATTETNGIGIGLASISAEPGSVNSGNPVEITAVFEEMSMGQPENSIVPDNNDTSTIKNVTLVTATASIAGIDGANAGKVNLIRSSGNEYSGVWKADVPAGVYNVTLAASSLQASETFLDVLQIEVIKANNATSSVSTA
jgi:hypothetical protein